VLWNSKFSVVVYLGQAKFFKKIGMIIGILCATISTAKRAVLYLKILFAIKMVLQRRRKQCSFQKAKKFALSAGKILQLSASRVKLIKAKQNATTHKATTPAQVRV